jgi:hypothetical protein
MTNCHLHGNLQTLAILPVIEGSQAVTTAVGRRQSQQEGISNPELDRLDLKIRPDAQGPGRKLHKERCSCMEVLIVTPPESG